MSAGARTGAVQATSAVLKIQPTSLMPREYGETMSGRNRWLPILLILLGFGAGCAEKITHEVDPPRKNPSSKWQKVIRKATRDGGVDYDFLAERSRPLERYLAWVGAHGQHKDWWGESKEDRRIAHLANAHNAMVIHTIIGRRPLSSPDEIQIGLYRWPGAGLSRGVRYRLDDEWVSPAKLRNLETVSRYQDPLLWLLFHDGSKESPPLQWWPNRGLQSRLKKTLRILLKTDAWLSKTENGWAAHPLFFAHQKDFLEWDDKQSLCDWLSAYAAGEARDWLEDHAEDCPLERVEDDRRLNQANR